MVSQWFHFGHLLKKAFFVKFGGPQCKHLGFMRAVSSLYLLANTAYKRNITIDITFQMILSSGKNLSQIKNGHPGKLVHYSLDIE